MGKLNACAIEVPFACRFHDRMHIRSKTGCAAGSACFGAPDKSRKKRAPRQYNQCKTVGRPITIASVGSERQGPAVLAR